MEEWQRDVLGLGIGGGRRTQQRWLRVKIVLAAANCWSMGFGGWWVDLGGGGSTLPMGLGMGKTLFFFLGDIFLFFPTMMLQ